jgi:hypothetical protein
MNKRVEKFLEFKGEKLLFLLKDGVYWIAVKPVCESIKVNYNRQYQNLNDDPILGPSLAVQQMQVPGDIQSRSYSCLPEYLIYGWLFSVKSESPDLLEYKKECYQILFDFFHGAITSRKELLREKAMIQHERTGLEIDLRKNEKFIRFEELRAREARLGISLKRIDTEEVQSQYDLFSSGTSDTN